MDITSLEAQFEAIKPVIISYRSRKVIMLDLLSKSRSLPIVATMSSQQYNEVLAQAQAWYVNAVEFAIDVACTKAVLVCLVQKIDDVVSGCKVQVFNKKEYLDQKDSEARKAFLKADLVNFQEYKLYQKVSFIIEEVDSMAEAASSAKSAFRNYKRDCRNVRGKFEQNDE